MSSSTCIFGGNLNFDHACHEWQIFKDRFVQFCIANDITEENDAAGLKRRALLLTALVDDTYRVVKDLAFPTLLDNVEYKALVALLDRHLEPKRCSFAERSAFYKAEQRAGEGLAEWAARVRRAAQYCGFGTELDTALRDRFVLGLEDAKEKERLFAESVDTLTMNKALELAQGVRCARQALRGARGAGEPPQLFEMRAGSGAGRATPAAAPSPAAQTRAGRCKVCGYRNHTTDQCRFSDLTCQNCNKKGHLRRMCKSRGNNFLQPEDSDIEDDVAV
ncbi:uncharacterized protein LOC125490620 [Plutella xylostella]|uniref:uncharacterized protein LOC125488905 n=1 Tax=Plutella xylostella TaxID=51655 RepID=UPI002032858B|nr:uncharacterized protein LOC125488905 [Plutella xylostella]XP_048486396.1 uncharacterized protein LOC125490620 [Plutella xylostella]